MKNTNYFSALIVILCLASCDINRPKTNGEVAKELSDIVVLSEREEMVEAPREGDPDLITKYGFLGLERGSEIPETMEGFDVEQRTYMSDFGEIVRYVYTKGDELVMEVEPIMYEKETNIVGIIIVYSERYQTKDGFHVGSLISEVMDTYGEHAYAMTIEDGLLTVNAEGLQFVLDREDYEGELPECNPTSCMYIKNPTFKSDATVKSIRIYLW